MQLRLISLASELLLQLNLEILPLIVRRLVSLRLCRLTAVSTDLVDPLDHRSLLLLSALRCKALCVADCKSRACAGLHIEEACIKRLQKITGVAR